MVDADGATEITDIEKLEKAMDEIAKDYVRCLNTVWYKKL